MIRLNLLGQIGLTGPDGTHLRRILAGDRRIGLLAFLAVAMPGTRRREAVLNLFWPDVQADEGRHRLRQLLYILRTELGENVLFTGNREEIALDPNEFWCDAIAFEAAYKRSDFETCARLYGGAFCDGLFVADAPAFEHWMDDTRDRMHEKAVDAAWQLAQRSEAAGQLLDALHWGKEALRLDPDEERLRWLLRIHERRGDRVKALRLFDRFQRTLADEFDIAPSRETLAIVDRIRSGAMPPRKVDKKKTTSA